jgi:hypothetical protein
MQAKLKVVTNDPTNKAMGMASKSKTKSYAKMAGKLKSSIMRLTATPMPFADMAASNEGKTQTFTLPFAQFAAWRNNAYQPHSAQRDHEGRVRAGKLDHVIDNFELPHGTIVLAHYNGEYLCADGNGRSLLWSNPMQMMARPAEVTVIVHYCETEEEFHGVYRCIDSSVSRKTVGDDIFGLMRNAGILNRMGVERMRSGLFKGALTFLNIQEGRKVKDYAGAINAYREELVQLSQMSIAGSRVHFPNVLVAVGLMLFKQRKVYAAEYLEKLYVALNGMPNPSPEIEQLLAFLAQDKLLKVESEALKPGCMKGQLGGEDPIKLLAPSLVDYYTKYEGNRAAMRPPKVTKASGRTKKVA